MVNHKYICCFFLLFSFAVTLYAQNIHITAEIDLEAYENEPLKGTISITHQQQDKVDTNSFSLNKKTLSVELVKEVQIAPNNPLILSLYRFQIPAQPQGLYALPPISVRVGGKTYQSSMSSYTVQPRNDSSSPLPVSPPAAPTIHSPSPPPSTEPTPPILRLEAKVTGSDSLYPGQHTTLTYIYYFSGNIALTTETLPLLDAKGLVKIGEKEIKDSTQGNISIREISQRVEANKPGTYTFGPSLIEGHAYTETIPGQPVYSSEKLSAKAPPIVITVKPFPKEKQPASFNGAVGNYTFETVLLSPETVTEGDEMSLALKISGTGNLKNIQPPDLCCQPGYSGFFRLSDLPPSEEIAGDTKTIVVKLKPLNTLIQSLPSIEFSFFNPKTAAYTTRHSKPIPIHVNPGKNTSAAAETLPTPPPSATKSTVIPNTTPKPIEIETIYSLSSTDLYNKLFGTWWALAIIPLGIGLLIYQHHLQQYLEWKKSQIPPVTSRTLFQKAFSKEKQGKCNFTALEQALRLALVEAGFLPTPNDPLPSDGLGGEVKNFWTTLEEKRFGGKGKITIEEIHRISGDLLNKIHAAATLKPQGNL